MQPDLKKQLAALSAQKRITLLVTDSGLGGLSIFARIVNRLKKETLFEAVSLVYFNAWPEQNRGYNSLKDMAERIRVFDRALDGMKRFEPDMILIACNTLSVLYDQTEFSQHETIPVIDIVRFGVDMVFEQLSRKKDAKAVLLGTITTIASGVHQNRLIEKGIPPERLIPQACDQLATQIEKGPASESVVQLVETFMDQAAQKLNPPPAHVFAALFCTHFGYCRDLIQEKLAQKVQAPVTVLDPNRRMADFLFEDSAATRHPNCTVTMRIVSRIVWDPEKIAAISGVIKSESPETAQALRNYEQRPDLFIF